MPADPVIEQWEGFVEVTLASGVTAKPGDLLGNATGWKLADADARIKAELICLGYGTAEKVPAAKRCVLFDADAPYTANNLQWLSATAGAHTATRPAIGTTLTFHQVVGRAVSTSRVFLDCGGDGQPPMYVNASVNPASLAATTSAETAVTITGVKTTDRIIANIPASLENDIAFSGIRISAADTVQLRLSNIDNTNAVDGAALTWEFVVFRSGDD